MVVADLTADARQDIIFYSQSTNSLQVWGLSDPIEDPPGPAAQLGQWRMLTQLRQAIARLDGVFALEGERVETAVALKRPEGVLRLEEARFAYDPGGPVVIDGLDGKIGPAGMHGVIGRNGCGKH